MVLSVKQSLYKVGNNRGKEGRYYRIICGSGIYEYTTALNANKRQISLEHEMICLGEGRI